MMYALQLHKIVFSSAKGYKISKPRNVFIDISSDGQPRRRYFVGRFDNNPNQKEYENIIHYCHSPVTLRMSYGPFYHTHLGVHTLFEFLQPDNSVSLPWKQELCFGNEDTMLFSATITMERISMEYKFELTEVNCLNQSSFFLRKDTLYAEVEFNRCSHSIHAGHVNTYELGRYKSQDTCSMHTHNTMSFNTVSSFSIAFYAKDMLSDHMLGHFRFIPILNSLDNVNLNINSFGRGYKSSVNRKLDNNSNTISKSRPLLFLNDPSDSYEDGEIIFNDNSLEFSRKIVLAATMDESGALYEISFSIKCEPIRAPIFGTPRSWDIIVNRETTKSIEKKFSTHLLQETVLNNDNFGKTTSNNSVEFMIDGKETFQRYYECICLAQHSINILAWELSLSFGLVETGKLDKKWITMEDVLLSRAKQGVKIRIIVWRHSMMTMLNRIRYMGPVEQEVEHFNERARRLGISFKVFHTTRGMPGSRSVYADPNHWNQTETIVVIIAGNPRGLISCHHEKLLLIDPECSNNCMAFTGGFDVARGRYDQPEHKIYSPSMQLDPSVNIPESFRRTTLLWHDSQLLIRGMATQQLYLHFTQRWIHAFTRENEKTRKFELLVKTPECSKHKNLDIQQNSRIFTSCSIRFMRNWNGSFDAKLFDRFCQYILSAKKFLYVEHQYPFQNGAITYYICESLKRNPNLRIIVVTPVKTDLPTGLLGEFFDWSQDHIIDHLNLIYSVAPDRVGIFGLISEEEGSRHIKPIYVHSKLLLIDDYIMLNGSTNMDNISFYYSSEVSVAVANTDLATQARVRLGREHLGKYWKPEMKNNYKLMFDAFCKVATKNMQSIKSGHSPIARPVWMTPTENYNFLLKKVYYPNKVSKFLNKMGINTHQISERISSLSGSSILYSKEKIKSHL